MEEVVEGGICTIIYYAKRLGGEIVVLSLCDSALRMTGCWVFAFVFVFRILYY